MKKAITLTLILALLLSLSVPALAFTAKLSGQGLSVNGETIECEKYNIDGSNYFKLRDLAQLLNGTGSQFDVGYDNAKKLVTITTNHAYTTPNGQELVVGEDKSATAKVSTQTIVIDGEERSDLTVYNIGGSNFFQLRDMGDALGFDVDYDSATRTMLVTSRESEKTSVSLDVISFRLTTGKTKQVIATVEPTGTAVTWKSSNPDIASVDANGVVKALKKGKSDIIATAGDKTVFCTVTVVGPTLQDLQGIWGWKKDYTPGDFSYPGCRAEELIITENEIQWNKYSEATLKSSGEVNKCGAVEHYTILGYDETTGIIHVKLNYTDNYNNYGSIRKDGADIAISILDYSGDQISYVLTAYGYYPDYLIKDSTKWDTGKRIEKPVAGELLNSAFNISGPSIPREPKQGVYAFLVNEAKSKGSYDDGAYTYTLARGTMSDGSPYVFTLDYESGTDDLTVNFGTMDEDSDTFYQFTILKDNTDKIELGALFTVYNHTTQVIGFFEPKDFTDSSGAVTFSYYNGYSEAKQSYVNLICSGIRLTFSVLEKFVLENGGYSLIDLGFNGSL